MGIHSYHDALPGFSPAQVLHDGCEECEGRAADPSWAIGKFDQGNFAAAWSRAAAWNRDGLPDLAKAEVPTLRVLWAVQLHLERLGVPIGELPLDIRRVPPFGLNDPPEYGPDDAEAQRIAEVFAEARAEQDRGL